MARTVATLAPYVASGVPVVGLEPSCLATLRSDAVELTAAHAGTVAGGMLSLAELLTRLDVPLPDLTGVEVVAQPHCHQHAVIGWAADQALLERAGATVTRVAGCCGLAGNFGMEKGHYEVSVAVAETYLLPAVRGNPDAVVLADGMSCRVQLDDLADVPAMHLAELLATKSPGPWKGLTAAQNRFGPRLPRTQTGGMQPLGSAAHWEPVSVPGFVGMQMHRETPGAGDRIVTADVGPVRVIDSHNGPGQALRTAKDIRADDPDRYALFVQGAGVSTGEQNGRAARFRPGDIGLVDLSRPMRCTFSARRAVMVTYPKHLSSLRSHEVSRIVGLRFPAGGTAGLVSSLVRQLPAHLDADDGAAGLRVGSAVLDLINVGVAAQLDRETAVSVNARRRALLLECRGFIEEHLANVELSPTTVAAAHHISVRYLHRLFEQTGNGVAELIRRRRLDRCRRDLLDPDLGARPVAAIGARWGLRDGARFSRVFRREFGLPPAEFRATFGGRDGSGNVDP